MKVGIVGGNSQVSVELALLLRDAGHEMVPVVRNRQAAAFLGHAGFDCRIADATDAGELRAALADVDTVVIAAYAGIGARDISDYRQAVETNEAIVQNSVEQSPAGATVVYFSSIAAFGNELFDSPIRGRFDQYTIAKRKLEELVRDAAEETGTPAYSLRLGHVFGPSQSNAERFRSVTDRSDELVVAADPGADANVVHTVTIADAVEVCAAGDATPGTYTVVNSPQWTWRELFDHYSSPSATLRFAGRPDDSVLSASDVLGRLVDAAVEHRMKLLPLQLFLPDRLNKRVVYEYKRKSALSNIAESTERFSTHEFEYRSVPGPFLADLTPTDELLEREQVVRDALDAGE